MDGPHRAIAGAAHTKRDRPRQAQPQTWQSDSSEGASLLWGGPVLFTLILIALHARDTSSAPFAEPYLFALIVLSPVMHAWYITWLIPFSVLTRNLGTRILGVAGFLYFLLHWHIHQPRGVWALDPWEHFMLWWPGVVAFFAWRFLSVGMNTDEQPVRVGDIARAMP